MADYTLNDFCIHFGQNSPNLMWFLGAGASRSARIRTAWDVTWDLKCKLYCNLENLDASKYLEYSSPAIRTEVQSYFSSKSGAPAEDSIDEYSYYFEQYFKENREAQRKYIDSIVKRSDIIPHYGHKFLGLLFKEKLANIIWTTNFDSLIEDAYSKVEGNPSDMLIAHLEAPNLAIPAINDKRFPLYVKLHGDFRYEKLKNTSEELKNQNAEFSKALEIACSQYGLMVVGYSGRDDSVMKVFNYILSLNNPFPQGLFWFCRPDTAPLPSVVELIDKAKKIGVSAHIIRVGTFDELARKLRKQYTKIDVTVYTKYLDKRFLASNAPIPSSGKNHPYVKTNALPIISIPKHAYQTEGHRIENVKSLKEARKLAKSDVTAIIRNKNILSYGEPENTSKIFGGKTTILELTSGMCLSPDEGAIKGLLKESLAAGLVKGKPLKVIPKGQSLFIRPDPACINDKLFEGLKKFAGTTINGTIPETEIKWSEAVEIKLDNKLSRLWLLLSPQVLYMDGDWDRSTYEAEKELMLAFNKNRTKMRRNYEIAGLLAVWQILLLGDEQTVKVCCYEDKNLNAQFIIENKLAVTARI